MPLVETLVDVLKPWAKFYSKSNATQAIVVFAHVAGMLGGGGLAIAADRAMWKARTATDDVRARLLAEVQATHRPVLIGIFLMVISGVLLFASDVKTFATSWIYWGKMVAFVLLLANGAWLQSMERGMQRAPATTLSGWPKLGLSSRLSYFLWFAVVLGGVLLKNA
jgi:hypothetical protein